MALKKSKTLNNGVVAEYWRSEQFCTNFRRLDAVITLAGYFSAEVAAMDSGESLSSYHHDLGVEFAERMIEEGMDKNKNKLRREIYLEFKRQAQAEAAKPPSQQDTALAWFADAIDC